jgi:hypothetical protein
MRVPRVAAYSMLVLMGCRAVDVLGDGSACNETLTGAVTAQVSCLPATSGWASDRGWVSIAQTLSPKVTVEIPFAGEPQVRSYTLSDIGGALGGVTLEPGWFAGQNFLPTGVMGTLGSYTLTLTSVRLLSSNGIGKSYIVHGELTATLKETYTGGGIGGTVILHATF